MEEYEEVETEYDDLSTEDVVFIGGGIIVLCFDFAFIMKTLKKNIKNMHLKIGDKIEVGVETKEDK